MFEGHRLFNPTVPQNNYWDDTNGVGPMNSNYTATVDREFFQNKGKMPENKMHGKSKMKEGKVF